MQRIRQRLVVTLPSYRNSWAKVHAGKKGFSYGIVKRHYGNNRKDSYIILKISGFYAELSYVYSVCAFFVYFYKILTF